jgi:2-polyprenyl-3-methyl-5-hydroxy-6-metoxy-1,4-benzoquinol methylase
MHYEPERYWQERYARLDITSSGHRDLPEKYNRWLYRRKQAVLRRGMRHIGFAPRDKRILEVGVGIGSYLDFWQRCGVREITGLDLSAAAITFLAERYPQVRFHRRDVTVAGLQADCGTGYDLVTALDVLYHVVDDALLDSALRNIFEVLRPGGVFALHDQFLHRPSEHHDYIVWRSLVQWEQALSRAGFEIVYRAPIFFCMVQPNDCVSPRAAARMDALWGRSNILIHRLPSLAGVIGYTVDTALGAMLDEGPSMELMLARRKA